MLKRVMFADPTHLAQINHGHVVACRHHLQGALCQCTLQCAVQRGSLLDHLLSSARQCISSCRLQRHDTAEVTIFELRTCCSSAAVMSLMDGVSLAARLTRVLRRRSSLANGNTPAKRNNEMIPLAGSVVHRQP